MYANKMLPGRKALVFILFASLGEWKVLPISQEFFLLNLYIQCFVDTGYEILR